MNPKRLLIVLLAVLAVLAGCSSVPSSPIRDRLDAQTGSTVTVLPHPLELLSPANVGVRAVAFAYLGPFEIDQMGARTLYLWVMVPNDVSAAAPPVILCDGKAIDLPARTGPLNAIGLSEPPYAPPYPWNRQWYFALTDAALGCFAQAHLIGVEIPGASEEAAQFSVESAKHVTGFPSLQALVAHRGN